MDYYLETVYRIFLSMHVNLNEQITKNAILYLFINVISCTDDEVIEYMLRNNCHIDQLVV